MDSSATQGAAHNSSSVERGSWAWFRLPLLVRRVFPSFALTLTDGVYLAALGRVGAALPLVAFCIGFVLSGFFLEPGQIFSASLFVLGVLIAVSGLGSALGVWLLGGYIVGDLLILRFARVPEVTAKFGQQGWRDVACVLVLYAILSLLLVTVPALSARLRQIAFLLPQEIWLAYTQARPANPTNAAPAPLFAKMSALGQRHQRALLFPLDAGLQIAFAGLLVYGWAQIAAIMLRSAFIWYQYPDVVSTAVNVAWVSPLQYGYAPLLNVAFCAAAVRVGLEYLATGKEDFVVRLDELSEAFLNQPGRAAGLISWFGEFVRALVLLVLLFGILMTPFYVVTTAVVLVFSILLRKAILPRVVPFARLVWSVPLIARIGAAAVLSYSLSALMLGGNLYASDFYPVLRPLWLSLLLSSLLFPDEAQRDKTERGQPL